MTYFMRRFNPLLQYHKPNILCGLTSKGYICIKLRVKHGEKTVPKTDEEICDKVLHHSMGLNKTWQTCYMRTLLWS